MSIISEMSEDADAYRTAGERINPYYVAMFLNGTREEQQKEVERLRRDPRYQQPTVDPAPERPPAACAISDHC